MTSQAAFGDPSILRSCDFRFSIEEMTSQAAFGDPSILRSCDFRFSIEEMTSQGAFGDRYYKYKVSLPHCRSYSHPVSGRSKYFSRNLQPWPCGCKSVYT